METIESINERIEHLEKEKSNLEEQRKTLVIEENRKTFKESLMQRNEQIMTVLTNVGYDRKVIPLFEIDRIYDNYSRSSGYENAVVTLKDQHGARPILSKDAPFNQILNWTDFITARILYIMAFISAFDEKISKPFYSSDTIQLKSDGLTTEIKLVSEDRVMISAYATLIESDDREIEIAENKHASIRITPCEAEAYFIYSNNDVSYRNVLDEILEINRLYEKAKKSIRTI